MESISIPEYQCFFKWIYFIDFLSNTCSDNCFSLLYLCCLRTRNFFYNLIMSKRISKCRTTQVHIIIRDSIIDALKYFIQKNNTAGCCSRFTKHLTPILSYSKWRLQSKSGSKSHRINGSSKSKNGSHLIISPRSSGTSGTFAQPKKIIIQQFFVSFGMWSNQIMSFKQLAPKTETIKTIYIFSNK